MDVRTGVELAATWARRYGLAGVKDLLYPVYYAALRPFDRITRRGTNVYDLEWDLLVVVDACRFDLFAEAWDRRAAGPVDSYRSVASMTREWMARTFTPARAAEIAETGYVCGNPFSESQLDAGDFAHFDEVWRDAWVEPGTVPPRAITDRVVDLLRRDPPGRTIAHYMQPHCPFIDRPHLSEGKDVDRFGSTSWPDVWERYRMGHISLETLWSGYRANLGRTLDEVELLVDNVDAEDVVLTSDHGNGIGEAGVYGHPPGQWIDAVREVPLVRLSATDTGEHTPAREHGSSSHAPGEQLEALGYR